MKVLKETTYGSDEKKYLPRQAARALKQLMMIQQQPGETLIKYYHQFESLIENTEEMYGEIAPSTVADKDQQKKKAEEKMKVACDQMLAAIFMDGANKGFKPLLRDLENTWGHIVSRDDGRGTADTDCVLRAAFIQVDNEEFTEEQEETRQTREDTGSLLCSDDDRRKEMERALLQVWKAWTLSF